jgi:GTPase SAR1 family protein
MKIIYLIGAPGAGKTTLTEAFTRDWQEIAKLDDPIKYRKHITPQGEAISLGWLRPNFGGTDTLGNTAIIPIEEWLPKVAKSNLTYLYGEGDRLANARFFNLAKSVGQLYLFYLDTDPAVAEQRRRERAALTGKQQNPSWVKGRETKHRNLAREFHAITIPGHGTSEYGAELMWNVILS